MSRSYKQVPIVKDHDSGKFGKKMANRKIRRCQEPIANGKAYTRFFESYEIHDHISRYSRQELLRDRESEEKRIQNGTETRRYVIDDHQWAKYFRRK